MTSYAGGKAIIGKKIYHDICQIEEKWFSLTKKHDQSEKKKLPYFEPFLGMAGVMLHFAAEKNSRNLYGCDVLPDIIEFWEAVTKHNWIPPPVSCWTREKWEELKISEPSALRCFFGVVASYRSIFFSSFRKPNHGRQDYYTQAVKKMEKFREPMKKVYFISSRSYHEFEPKGFLIYCDPPYHENKLGLWKNFDSKTFWETMRKWSVENLVLITERSAPHDFIPVSEYPSHMGEKKYTTYLFMHKNTRKKLQI